MSSDTASPKVVPEKSRTTARKAVLAGPATAAKATRQSKQKPTDASGMEEQWTEIVRNGRTRTSRRQSGPAAMDQTHPQTQSHTEADLEMTIGTGATITDPHDDLATSAHTMSSNIGEEMEIAITTEANTPDDDKILPGLEESIHAPATAPQRTTMIYSFGKEWDQVDTTGWPPSTYGFYEKMRETFIMMPTPQTPQTTARTQDPDIQMSDDANTLPPKGTTAAPDRAPPTPDAKSTPARSKLMSRIAAASLHAPATTTTNDTSNTTNPTFTPAPFPIIHTSHPTAPLDHVDPNQLAEWEDTKTPKFIVRPFDNEARDPANHSKIAGLIQQIVQEATRLEEVNVAAPLRAPRAVLTNALPNCFLVYEVTDAAVKIMTDNGIWSTTRITFQALPFDPTIPFLLFPLAGFTTTDTSAVRAIVNDHWTRPPTVTFLDNIVDETSRDTNPVSEDDILQFIRSLKVERVDTKSAGGVLNPRFNIMANGPILGDDERWYKIRDHLRNILYTSHMHGTGTAQDYFPCTLCHAADHPRGLCSFPLIPGWNGPGHRPTPTVSSPQNKSGFPRWNSGMRGTGRRGRAPRQ